MNADEELIKLVRECLHDAVAEIEPARPRPGYHEARGGRPTRRGRLRGALALVPAVAAAVLVAVVALTSLHSAAPSSASAPTTAQLNAARQHVLAEIVPALGPPAPGFSGAPPATAQAALAMAAAAAAASRNTPPLKAGQAWYSTAEELASFELFAGPTGTRALPKFTQALQEEAKWFGIPSSDAYVDFNLGPAGQQIGGGGGGNGVASGPPGFGDWDAFQRFAAIGTPTEVLGSLSGGGRGLNSGYLGYTHGNTELQDTNRSALTLLAKAAQILGAEPVSPRSRAALLRALGTLPGLGYLPGVRDPLGRRGVAITETTTTVRAFDIRGLQRYTFELIFNPATGTVLGSRTIATDAIPAMHARAGTVLFYWAYRLTRVVSAGSAPSPGAGTKPERHLDGRFIAQIRAIRDSPACRPFARAGGGFRKPQGRCEQLLNALEAGIQLAELKDPAVIAAWQREITPPPAVGP